MRGDSTLRMSGHGPRLSGPAAAFLAGALTVVPPAVKADPADDLGGGTDFGRSYKPLDARMSKGRNFYVLEPPSSDTPRYFRFRLKVANPDGARWSVAVRSPAGQLLSTFDQTETACQEQDGCWTVRLETAEPHVGFETDSPSVAAEIREALYMPATAVNTYYSYIDGSNVQSVANPSGVTEDEVRKIQERADRLGLFIGSGITPDGQESANWCCSGVRLTADLFLTNWHCGAARGMPDGGYWTEGHDAKACRSGIVDMSFDGDQLSREYGCEAVAFVDKDLDAAVLRLSRLADGPALTPPLRPLRFGDDGGPSAGEEIQVFHHPACKPKSVTLACTVAATAVQGWADPADGSEFAHLCTTERGSSGGPVFDTEGRLVGLHHLGADPARGPGNFAVRISDLLAKIEHDKPELYREIKAGSSGQPQ